MADIVMFLYREDYYDDQVQDGTTELIIAKQRNGPTGKVELAFLKEHSKFIDFK